MACHACARAHAREHPTREHPARSIPHCADPPPGAAWPGPIMRSLLQDGPESMSTGELVWRSFIVVLLVSGSACASGLTLGLMSLDMVQVGALQRERSTRVARAAGMSVRRRHRSVPPCTRTCWHCAHTRCHSDCPVQTPVPTPTCPQLKVLMRSGTAREQKHVSRVMPVVADAHWLLCTLLLWCVRERVFIRA